MNAQKAKNVAAKYREKLLTGDYLEDMIRRMLEIPNEEEGKLMRWLGFIQGVLWERKAYTLSKLKGHNRDAMWCGWCKVDTHNDGDCWCTRPV